jgi:hypothetical protein
MKIANAALSMRRIALGYHWRWVACRHCLFGWGRVLSRLPFLMRLNGAYSVPNLAASHRVVNSRPVMAAMHS